MTELKIQDDILKMCPEAALDGSYEDGYAAGFVLALGLSKQEAIKHYHERLDVVHNKDKYDRPTRISNLTVCDWIKRFFNITDKEIEDVTSIRRNSNERIR